MFGNPKRCHVFPLGIDVHSLTSLVFACPPYKNQSNINHITAAKTSTKHLCIELRVENYINVVAIYFEYSLSELSFYFFMSGSKKKRIVARIETLILDRILDDFLNKFEYILYFFKYIQIYTYVHAYIHIRSRLPIFTIFCKNLR